VEIKAIKTQKKKKQRDNETYTSSTTTVPGTKTSLHKERRTEDLAITQ